MSALQRRCACSCCNRIDSALTISCRTVRGQATLTARLSRGNGCARQARRASRQRGRRSGERARRSPLTDARTHQHVVERGEHANAPNDDSDLLECSSETLEWVWATYTRDVAYYDFFLLRLPRGARAFTARALFCCSSRYACDTTSPDKMNDEERDMDVEAERRTHRSALERRRRDRIKFTFDCLRDAVPSLQWERATRSQILKRATDYIQLMERKNREWQRTIKDLKRQRKHLEQQIRALEETEMRSGVGDCLPSCPVVATTGEGVYRAGVSSERSMLPEGM
ncbi:hypothetical protein HPB49_001234 [Dermacentor silvarum]|uniref:Uncharacterized protein n=1 Tax=Dermacentor silvarum TaxID=543639 RepID=A0ACB8CIW3_DERSI|nr:hypothetical protein HPB49_001234 [Dermacentor silvarum]